MNEPSNVYVGPYAAPPTRRLREDKTTVSLFVWVSLLVFALSAFLVVLKITDEEGFFDSLFGVTMPLAFLALGLAITGVVRSRVKWPGVVAIVLSALPSVGPFAFMLFLIIWVNFVR